MPVISIHRLEPLLLSFNLVLSITDLLEIIYNCWVFCCWQYLSHCNRHSSPLNFRAAYHILIHDASCPFLLWISHQLLCLNLRVCSLMSRFLFLSFTQRRVIRLCWRGRYSLLFLITRRSFMFLLVISRPDDLTGIDFDQFSLFRRVRHGYGF